MNRSTILLAALTAFACLPANAGDAAAGKDKAEVCGACHGPDGNSPSPMFPRLAGQHEDYLARALRDYQLGRRKNPIMQPQAEALSKEDIADLAAWFASQSGLTVKR
jgi:cytochrome c553